MCLGQDTSASWLSLMCDIVTWLRQRRQILWLSKSLWLHAAFFASRRFVQRVLFLGLFLHMAKDTLVS